MKKYFYNFVLLIAWILCLEPSIAIAQIPAQGADIPGLAGLHWGMTQQEALDILHGVGDVKMRSSSMISYHDMLMGNEVEVFLKFAKKDTLLVLISILVAADGSDEYFRSLEQYYLHRYGNSYEEKKGHESGIDKEKKIWRLGSETAAIQILLFQGNMMKTEITYSSVVTTQKGPEEKIHIRASGISSMAILQWGMSIQEAHRTVMGKYLIADSAASEFSYVDTLPMAKTKVTLKFDGGGSHPALYAINAELMEPNREILQSLVKDMVARYGEKYETTAESQSKLFYTVRLEMKRWSLGHESIALMVLSHGEDVKKINLRYTYTGS